MLHDSFFKKLCTEQFGIPPSELENYEKSAKKVRKDIEAYLIDEGIIDETRLYTAAAELFQVPFISLKGKEIPKEVLNIVPPALAQTHQMIAFAKSKQSVSIAMLDPEDIQTIEFLQRKSNLSPEIYLTTPGDIKDALRRYHAELDQDIKIRELSNTNGDDNETELQKAAQEVPIINIVNSILEHAVYEGASDIHIEPTEKDVVVRFRVDGVLQTVMTLPKSVKNGIIARMKILADLKIDEHMLPQDGRFKILVQEEKYSFRVSIMPVYDGEKIVLRLLHEGEKPLTLDQLGFLPGPKELLKKAITRPHGMLLVTGPTGSGKTTSLYSVLGMLNNPGVNICTIEDPIEYHVGGVNQSQVNTRVGFSFAQGLRAFLRQDPDIVMVGEIRDQETAEIAMHAAMTGHLVLSTLHTNDAVSTIARLLDMGIPGFLLASTLNVVVAQRLVRRLNEKTATTYTLSPEAAKEITERAGGKDIGKTISTLLNIKESRLEAIPFYRPDESKKLQHDGYKGRVGIYEMIEITPDFQKAISENADTNTLRALAEKQGMISMFEDGMVKAAQGITSIEEVLRVTKE